MLYSYLNNQHIRKQKISEAELNYGSLVIDHAETMKEIGELGLDIWRRQMIEPLKDELVRLLLDGIRYDRLGSGSGSTERTQFQADSTIKGVISSFVEVEEYKKKGNLDVRFLFHFYTKCTTHSALKYPQKCARNSQIFFFCAKPLQCDKSTNFLRLKSSYLIFFNYK